MFTARFFPILSAILLFTILTIISYDACALYRFAVIPKSLGNPIFDVVRAGCKYRARELGNVDCVYQGTVGYEPVMQSRIVRDLIIGGIDGLAISVTDAGSMTKMINDATKAGVPVVTFDSDAPNSSRISYIGTNNLALGTALARQLRMLKQEGGKYAILSGTRGSVSLSERVKGVRKGLADDPKWTEISGSPVYCEDDVSRAIKLMYDIKIANPDIVAIVSVGGWPTYAEEGYRKFVRKYEDEITSRSFLLVIADTLPVQVELFREGYIAALVGQNSFAIGKEAIDTLLAIKQGKQVPQIIYTGLNILTGDELAGDPE